MRRSVWLGFGLASVCALALAQHSPAPDRPAEGPLRANPGAGPAPGVHPPAPMDGNRFAPGPPPEAREESPSGRVKTVETVTVPTPGPTAAVSPAPKVTSPASAATPAVTPVRTPAKKVKRPAVRRTRPAGPAATPTPRS